MKHQGQPSARSTTGYTKAAQSGKTLHQRSTSSDSHRQSMAKSTHQGQMHQGSSGKYQGHPHGTSGAGMSRKSKGGSISGTSGY